MQYLYRGEFQFKEGEEDDINVVVNILRVADEEFLDDVSSPVPPISHNLLTYLCFV